MAATALITDDDDEVRNFETYALVWLDPAISHSPEFAQVLPQLRSTINYFQVLKNKNECLAYVYSVTKEERIILIVSGRLGQEVVPIVHDLETIVAVYVYCMDKQKYEQWARPFLKVKRIVVHLGELVVAVREDHTARQLNKASEPVGFTHISQADLISEHTLADSDVTFVYSHFLLDSLRQTSSAVTDKTELLALCRDFYEGNEPELRTLEEFEETYLPSRALWWYTRQSFLYRLVNKALRARNVPLLHLLRFYLHDIERQIEKNRVTIPVRAFFAQALPTGEAEQLKRSIGDYLSVSSFLSTGSKQQALACLTYFQRSANSQLVLFEIEADPRLDKVKPFANVTALSYFPNDEQILFMPGTIFRSASIEVTDGYAWIVRLVLCSENDRFLHGLLHEHFEPNHFSFGDIFCRLGRYDEAESFYRSLIKSLPADHEDVIMYYNALGSLARERGDLHGAIRWFNKTLAVQNKTLEPGDLTLADLYCNLAEIYRLAKDYRRSMDSFDRAMTAYRDHHGDEHPMVAVCVFGMGRVYFDQKDYNEALKAFEKALHMRQTVLAPTDSHLAETYKSIAETHHQRGRDDHALPCYEKALHIYQRSASPSDLAMSSVLKSIGRIHETNGQFETALLSYQRAANCLSRMVLESDPQLAEIVKDIERVTGRLQ